MKKIVSLISAFLLSVSVLAVSVSAEDSLTETVEVNGIIYEAQKRDNEIDSYTMKEVTDTEAEKLIIPAEINGCPIYGMWDKDLFANCKNLKEFEVEDGSEVFYAEDGVLMCADYLACYPQSKEGSTYTIPDHVTQIAQGAFNTCPSLEVINLPEHSVMANNNAFLNCESLMEINGVLQIKSDWFSETFSTCKQLKSLSLEMLPDSTTVLFDDFENLESVTFCSSDTIMPDIAFINCPKLQNIELDNNQYCIFYLKDCPEIKTLDLNGNEFSAVKIVDCAQLEEIQNDKGAFIDRKDRFSEISDFVNGVGFYVAYCPKIKTLTIPPLKDLSEISSLSLVTYQIENCETLEQINVQNCYQLSVKDCPALQVVSSVDTDEKLIEEVFPVHEYSYGRRGPEKIFDFENLPSLNQVILDEENTIEPSIRRVSCDNIAFYGNIRNYPIVKMCNNYDIPYFDIEKQNLTGDINNDGKIDIVDVLTVNRFILGKTSLTSAQQKLADVSTDGQVTPEDALLMMKKIVGIIESF